MKKIFFSVLSFCAFYGAIAQDKLQEKVKPMIEEGKSIYKIEMASQIANKLFSSQYKGKDQMAGCFSYPESDNVRAVIYSVGEKPKVLESFLFSEKLDETDARPDMTPRELNATEKELCKMYKNAIGFLNSSSTLMPTENGKFSVVVLSSSENKKAFILNESTKEGVVIFGNDYLLTFDSKLNVLDNKALHKNVAMVKYDKDAGTANDTGSSHTHVAADGEMVTSTDIATLLLNESQTKWSQHTFISENYIFFWNNSTQDIQVISKTPPKTK